MAKKLLILHAILFMFLCISSKEMIPQSVPGESFYAESTAMGEKILTSLNWKLVKIDTIGQKGKSPVYLYHYIK